MKNFSDWIEGRVMDAIEEAETRCPRSDDDQHCRHWYDGGRCCSCGAPGMTEEQMVDQGMIDDVEIARVDGGATCPNCGKTYREHPWDEENVGYDGNPFLRVGCDGKRLKL